MNEKITDFLDEVCSHIKYREVHNEIRAELAEHILETAKEIGIDKAILNMGSSLLIGENLNKQHKPKTEWSIIGLIALITLIGGMALYGSSYKGYSSDIFSRHLIFVAAGILVMLCVYFFDYTRLKKYSLLIYFLTMTLICITLISGDYAEGRVFLRITGIALSTDYAAAMFILSFAGFIEKYQGQGIHAILKMGILGVFSYIAMILSGNVSGMAVLAITYTVLVLTAVVKNYFGGNKIVQVLTWLGLAGTAFLFYIFFAVQGKQVTADGGITVSQWIGYLNPVTGGNDNGLKKSMQSVTTDYAFINITFILGWAGAITLTAAIIIFIIRMFITSKKIKNNYGFFLSLSVCAALSAQFILNTMLNFNLISIAGMGMPFVSYGGTGFISNMALAGLLLAVWRRNNWLSGTRISGEKELRNYNPTAAG